MPLHFDLHAAELGSRSLKFLERMPHLPIFRGHLQVVVVYASEHMGQSLPAGSASARTLGSCARISAAIVEGCLVKLMVLFFDLFLFRGVLWSRDLKDEILEERRPTHLREGAYKKDDRATYLTRRFRLFKSHFPFSSELYL